MKTKAIIAVVVVVVFIGTNIGSFIGGRCSVKPVIKIVEKGKIVWKNKIVYRDYEKYSCSELAADLLKYDTSEPRLDGIMRGDIFHATAGLNKREWSRDFTLKAGTDEKALYYILTFFGGMVAGGVVGGACDYAVTHKIK